MNLIAPVSEVLVQKHTMDHDAQDTLMRKADWRVHRLVQLMILSEWRESHTVISCRGPNSGLETFEPGLVGSLRSGIKLTTRKPRTDQREKVVNDPDEDYRPRVAGSCQGETSA
jgi:hypothetical protein